MISEILIALLVVGLVGLIAAILLVIAAVCFKVEVDETFTKVRECLPGANCGACGFAGCDAYAEALAEGKVKANLCIPGALEVVEKVSAVLGIAVEEGALKETSVAVVHCNGTCEAAPRKAIYDGVNSCRAASSVYGGDVACRFGCLGCGDCAAECPMDAICINGGIAHVDSRACIGCGVCVKTCPKNIISLVPRDSKVIVLCSNTEKGAVARKNCSNACIGCKKCENNCPADAIKVTDNLAKIDYDKCTGCGLCESNCPVKCIKTVDFETKAQ